MTNTDWATPGTRAAIFDNFRNVTITTVERLTATQIVCSKDRRFRRDTGRQVGASSRWSDSTLRPLDDRQVVNALARQRLSALRSDVNLLCRDPDNVESVLAALDQIAEAVAATRTAITNPGATR